MTDIVRLCNAERVKASLRDALLRAKSKKGIEEDADRRSHLTCCSHARAKKSKSQTAKINAETNGDNDDDGDDDNDDENRRRRRMKE